MVDIRSPGVLDSPDALVRLVLAGDEAAFARIVRLYRPDMVRVCFVITGDIDLAYEAVAVSWPHAWNRIASLRERSRLREWLCALAAREAVQLARTWAGHEDHRLRLLALDPGASRTIAGPIADRGLAAALKDISLADRRLLALRYVAGLTAVELAIATGLSPAAAMERAGRLAATLDLERRLTAHAAVPVPHVNVDAVARRARILRHDDRYRAISLVIAMAAGAVVAAAPIVGAQRTPAMDRVTAPLIETTVGADDPSSGCVRLAGVPIDCDPPAGAVPRDR